MNVDRFLARCPIEGEHKFVVRDCPASEHFWCDLCGLDGSGKRHKCKHCNYKLHDDCYNARKEMKCPSRPGGGHKYLTRDASTPFWCDGCREIGVGIRFKCESCYYRLHEMCFYLQWKCKSFANPPTTTNANFPGKVFQFIPQHPGNSPGQVCSPCGRDV
ncbi:uncharacterized protein LOC124929714 [Impatiens glandulifera]|uniref:uncharacterized protein LOC124929714 n=1 Tax=Impatiens glandulifera TaxID=253017 RepID=UPI001FB0CBF2|nr:uncharacterized protein LOC124929714 [Impatiens glandulifera]